MLFRTCLILLLSIYQVHSECNVEGFTNHPTDTEVLVGANVTLECSVDENATTTINDVVWFKDGFALLFNHTTGIVNSEPRYVVDTDTGGTFNLNLYLATYTDAGEFLCQICLNQSQQATVSVWKTPDSPYVLEDENGYVTVIADQQTDVTCVSNNAKPVATVKWISPSGEEPPQTTEVSEADANGLTETRTTMTIMVNTTANDTEYTCEVDSDALDLDDPDGPGTLSTSVKFNVIVGPAETYIESTSMQSDAIVSVDEGDNTNATCWSTNAAPAVTITWYRVYITDRQEVNSSGDGYIGPDLNGLYDTFNTIDLIGDAVNDGAKYVCEAINDAINVPKTASIILQVNEPINIGLIIAVVVSSVILILIIILIIYCVCKSDKTKEETTENGTVSVPVVGLPAQENAESETENVTNSSNTAIEPTVNVEAQYMGESNSAYFEINEDSNENETTDDEEEESSEEEDDFSENSSEEEEEDDNSSASTVPPPGDTFSISSSVRRSDRGSPIHLEDVEGFGYPDAMSPVASNQYYISRQKTDV